MEVSVAVLCLSTMRVDSMVVDKYVCGVSMGDIVDVVPL